jgi:hypothetical protein
MDQIDGTVEYVKDSGRQFVEPQWAFLYFFTLTGACAHEHGIEGQRPDRVALAQPEARAVARSAAMHLA